MLAIDFSRLQSKLTMGGSAGGSFLVAFGMGAVVALLAGAGLVQMGPELRTGVILTACLPTFSTLVLFAQEAGHEGLASIALMLCTCLSFVTVNLALLLLAG